MKFPWYVSHQKRSKDVKDAHYLAHVSVCKNHDADCYYNHTKWYYAIPYPEVIEYK